MNLSFDNKLSIINNIEISENKILEEKEDLTYEILTSKDKEEAKCLVALSFMDEPFTKLISTHIKQINLNDFYNFISIYLEEVSSNNLSVIVKEKKTNKIIGLSFNLENNYLDSKLKNTTFEENIFDPVFALINYAWDNAFKEYPYLASNRTAIDIFQLALHPEWRGKKIANNLVSHSIQLIKDKGYKYAVCEATSFFTRKVMEKFSFECIYKLDVRTFEYNGKYVFASQQPPHQEFTLWCKKLD